MRPVNLIPLEERRGQQAPGRTGPLPYLVLGVLVAALAGVTALVLINNQISHSKSQIVKLEREDAAMKVRAEHLSAYTQFHAMHEARVQTVSQLANSRFDWERVMRELSRVLPKEIWLNGLSATASPEVSIEGATTGESQLRAEASGPALVLSGCATSQAAVARFVSTLKDIDGVTRVAVQSSELPESEEEGAGVSKGGEGEGAENGDDCRTRPWIPEFEIVVAFDAAPVPMMGSASEAAPVSPTEQAEKSAAETAEEGSKPESGPEGS